MSEENDKLANELDGWRNDRKESSEAVTNYQSSIANELLNGSMGKDIERYFEIEEDKKEHPEKYKDGILKRFLDFIFRTF